MWHEIFVGVYFCGLAIFCVLRELIFVIRTGWFFFLGIIFLQYSQSTQCPALITFSFLPSTFNRNTYRKIPKISAGAYIFQRPFLRGLFLEGLIFGGAYLRREVCVSKSIALAL